MKDAEIQLFLFRLIIFLFVIIFLLSIHRLIKIFVHKKIENADDLILLLMFLIPIGIFLYIYYCIKNKFKKESGKQIKEESNGIEDVFKM